MPRVSVPYWSGQWLQPLYEPLLVVGIGVSVPYWSGQWLQPSILRVWASYHAFQSPIGRVSGCNLTNFGSNRGNREFQSPIGRVSGCNTCEEG